MREFVTIGEAARISGVKVPTIRYYEDIGLVPAPARTPGNRREYSENDLKRLAFIRHARELGFEIDTIRTLLDLQDDPGQSCSPADSIARLRLKDVEDRIDRLSALKAELERMIRNCSHGTIAECCVIDSLSNHAKCSHSRH
jgi:DNA-binding transcriptional MerR regulator